jgi:hypothetical protein
VLCLECPTCGAVAYDKATDGWIAAKVKIVRPCLTENAYAFHDDTYCSLACLADGIRRAVACGRGGRVTDLPDRPVIAETARKG